MDQNIQEGIIIIKVNNDVIDGKQAYPNIKSTVTLFFALILNSIIVAIPGIAISINLPKNLPVLKSLCDILFYVVPILLTIYGAIKRSKKQQGYTVKINFNKIQWWIIPLVIIGTFCLIIPLSWATSLIPMPVSVQKMFEKVFTKDLSSVFTVVLIAPLLEEILCRGIILKGLLKNYSPYKAILISAIFFAAIHLNPWQAVTAFLGGVFLGWVYYKTQSVIACIVIHTTINLTATSFLFLPTNKQNLVDLFGMPYYIVSFLASVTLFVGVCVIIQRKVIAIPESIFSKGNGLYYRPSNL